LKKYLFFAGILLFASAFFFVESPSIRMMMGAVAVCAIFLLLAGVYIYMYVNATRLPDDSPGMFLAGEMGARGRKVIVCAGDSLTHGRVSENYVDILKGWFNVMGYSVINAGINQELAWNLLQRVDEIVKCKPDFVTILIGINDVNASMNEKTARRYIREKGLPQNPDVAWDFIMFISVPLIIFL